MTRKKLGGFSYIEILVALALFSIIFASAIAMLGQSRRNLVYAQEGYAAHLAAHRLMLATRDALGRAPASATPARASLAAAISDYAEQMDVEIYSVWIFGASTMEFHSDYAPEVTLALGRLSELNISGNASVIVTVVWNEHGNISGRAVGVR
ncbi:MAG: hypothetical protein FWB91_07045 [Defluviitaleaceae bacterium]|nr:hypothetical protein [Defluviitaleaceae bacterium]